MAAHLSMSKRTLIADFSSAVEHMAEPHDYLHSVRDCQHPSCAHDRLEPANAILAEGCCFHILFPTPTVSV